MVCGGYNNNFRKQYAGIGFVYNASKNKFLCPQPYASWSLDGSDDWQASSHGFYQCDAEALYVRGKDKSVCTMIEVHEVIGGPLHAIDSLGVSTNLAKAEYLITKASMRNQFG